MRWAHVVVGSALWVLAGCQSESADNDTSGAALAAPPQALTAPLMASAETTELLPSANDRLPMMPRWATRDTDCGTFAAGTPAFTRCEQANFARVLEAPTEQLTNPQFVAQLLGTSVSNTVSLLTRTLQDPSWLMALNTPVTPLCATGAGPCAGDPFLTPDAVVEPVVFYDRECARLSGRVWRPTTVIGPLPQVVIQNGSVQAPEALYHWMAQSLVRAGYAVLTFDPRGQGRSDNQTPQFEPGSNFNPTVFWEGLVDAIDFIRSSPERSYPHEATCAGTTPTATARFNPQHAVQDLDRLGLVGHSLGATGVSVVQSYGAPGTEPWPGVLDETNPVRVVVAWDSLRAPGTGTVSSLPSPVDATPPVVPQVPAMGQSSEYGLVPIPFRAAPDPAAQTAAFRGWQAAGVPAMEFTIRGSTHYEWSLLPVFPATSWCPRIENNQCVGGWGRPMAEHYSVAWLDRWLKQPGEPGFDTADARLLDDAAFSERFSFYSRSARDFPSRDGTRQRCTDLLSGCVGQADRSPQ